MSHSNEVIGLTELREGLLYLIIFSIIGFIAGVAMYVSLLSTLALPFIISGLVLIIVLALSISITLAKIRPGFRYLSQVDTQFKISYTGTTLIIVGLVIAVIGIIALIATLLASLEAATYPSESPYDYLLGGTAITSFVVLILGAIIALVGEILTFVIGSFRLHGKYNESLYLVAGILYIIAMTGALIFGLIAAILLYMALGTTINKLTTR